MVVKTSLPTCAMTHLASVSTAVAAKLIELGRNLARNYEFSLLKTAPVIKAVGCAGGRRQPH
jgi:hypothetical protein